MESPGKKVGPYLMCRVITGIRFILRMANMWSSNDLVEVGSQAPYGLEIKGSTSAPWNRIPHPSASREKESTLSLEKIQIESF